MIQTPEKNIANFMKFMLLIFLRSPDLLYNKLNISLLTLNLTCPLHVDIYHFP